MIIDKLKLIFCRVLCFGWSRNCNRGISSIDTSIFFLASQVKSSVGRYFFVIDSFHDILRKCSNEFDDCQSCPPNIALKKNEGVVRYLLIVRMFFLSFRQTCNIKALQWYFRTYHLKRRWREGNRLRVWIVACFHVSPIFETFIVR